MNKTSRGQDVADKQSGRESETGAQLHPNEEWLSAVVMASRDGILVEADEQIIYVNRAYTQMFGYEDPTELTGRHVSVVILPEDRERLLEYGRQRARGERPTSVYEFKGWRKDGSSVAVEASVSTSVVADRTYITTMIRDITERKQVADALRHSEQLLRHLIHNIPDGSISVFDKDLRYLIADGQSLSSVGLSPEKLVGHTLFELFDQEAVDFVVPYYRRALAGETLAFELEVGGRWYLINAGPLENTERQSNNIIAVAHDITERKHADERVRQSEENLRAMIEQANVGIVRITTDGRLAKVNPAFNKMLGYAPEEMHGLHLRDITHPDDYALEETLNQQLIAGKLPGYSIEKRYLRKDGEIIWGNMSATFVRLAAGEPSYILAIVEDSSERKRAEAALKDANEDLEGRVATRTAELTEANVKLHLESAERWRSEAERTRTLRRLIFAQEDERRRIAGDIHDHFGQQMITLILKIGMLKTRIGGQPELQAEFEGLETIAKQLDQEIDFLVWELRPTLLDDLGLPAALATYARNWSRNFGIPVNLNAPRLEDIRLTPDSETVLYRIVQEALNNIAKHANAQSVSLTLERRLDQMSLIIEDDGVGFDPATTPGTEAQGLGITGMRERAALIGGSFEIKSQPGAGVTVSVNIPAPPVARRKTEHEE